MGGLWAPAGQGGAWGRFRVGAYPFRSANPPCNHSASFDHRRSPCCPLTAMANARFCPTSTTKRLPRVMLSAQWDNNRWIFRALGFVNRGGVAQRQLIRFAEAISDHAPVKDDGQF